METRPLTLMNLFRREVRFVVPLFQRPYVWTRDLNWEPLWEDVLAAYAVDPETVELPPHFLGAVVLDQMKGPMGTTEVRQVIDGQQRLTTLQLLLAAVRDLAVELELPDKYVKSLRRLTVNDDEMSDDPDDAFKVWPTNADRGSFRDAMGAGSATALTARYPSTRPTIVQAYLFFAERAREWSGQFAGEDLHEAFERLVAVLNNGMQAVVIDLGGNDNPQVIFESLNARGTPLQASDLVRNHLFHAAEQQGLDAEKLYEEHWVGFDDGYWREDVRQGRLVRPRLDAFLGHFLTMELAREVPTHQLFLTFRHYVRKTNRSLPEVMARFAEYGSIYSSLDTGQGLDRYEQAFVRRLDALDTTVVMPVLLHIFGSYQTDARRPVLVTLESYLLRRLICRLTTKNYNRMLLDLLKRLSVAAASPSDLVEEFLAGQTVDSNFWPSDEDVRRAIATLPLYKQLTRSRLRMLLGLIDERLQTGKTEHVVRPLNNLTIEHLLPQAWQGHWPLRAVDDLGRSREEQRRQDLLHTLGNLTLTTQKLNQSISNGPWSSKRHGLLAHSALNLNRSLPEAWSEEAILARGGHLADVLCAALPRPLAHGGTAAEKPELTVEAEDDLVVAVESERDGQVNGRRNVGRHIVEVLRAEPPGTVLTVSQIARRGSAEYPDADVSSGAVAARLRAGTTSGVRTTTNANGSLAAMLTSEPAGSTTTWSRA